MNGDAATIFRPSPKEEATSVCESSSAGARKVLAEAKAAFDKKEFAWAGVSW